MDMIFAKLEEQIEDLLDIKTAAEFFETFDHDSVTRLLLLTSDLIMDD
jgi:hypothetical protein